MNSVTLIGRVVYAPRYFCTPNARDLTRFGIVTVDAEGKKSEHECVAWGTPALSLHEKLRVGQQVMIRGRLRNRNGTRGRASYVSLTNYLILDRVERVGLSPCGKALVT